MRTRWESRLRAGDLGQLTDLLKGIGLAEQFTGDAVLLGSDPVIRSPHHLGEASATALLLIGAAGAAIWQARNGTSTDVCTNVIHALHYLHPTHYVRQGRFRQNVGAEHVPTNGIFQTRDKRYIMIEAGPPYPKLLSGYLNFFDCGNSRASLAREIAKWDAEQLEDALSDVGLPACRAFTRDEWLRHPQGRTLAAAAPIEIVKIADGEPIPFAANGASPLDGIRVLDFTHVLAGPRSTRTLAEYGADVLRIASPFHADTLPQHLGTDVGKHNAYLDLRCSEDIATMREIASTTDVFASTYRPTVNARFDLRPRSLAALSTRGLVYMSATAYGHRGPWRDRPGFDQNAQVATGFAMTEGQGGPPRFSPVFYLADLITGYLAAAGIMAALYRRAVEGGSYHVKVSLARSAMWVQEFGLLDTGGQPDLPRTDTYPAQTVSVDTVYGPVTGLAPSVTFSNLVLPVADRLVPYGSDAPSWPLRCATPS